MYFLGLKHSVLSNVIYLGVNWKIYHNNWFWGHSGLNLSIKSTMSNNNELEMSDDKVASRIIVRDYVGHFEAKYSPTR